MYQSLVTPNTAVTAKAGMCLWTAEEVFHTPHAYPSATAAYQATQFKHTDALPDVPVPVWFDSYGAYGTPAVWDNWGHVVSWIPGRGFLSSPVTFVGPGQEWFPSIDALVNAINRILPNSKTKYLGWSEDLAGIKLVKEEDMITIQQVDHVLKMGLRREPTAEELNNPAYQTDAGLLIDTVWNNGGAQLYKDRDVLKAYEPVTETLFREKKSV